MKTALRNQLNQKLIDILVNEKQEPHQAVLNGAYDLIPKDDNWTYSKMLDETANQLGQFGAWLVIIGKYNQLVCNGGHSQYELNGYADKHQDLIELSKHFGKVIFNENLFGIFMYIIRKYYERYKKYVTDNENSNYSDEWTDENDYSDLDDLYSQIYEEVLKSIDTFLKGE